MADDVVDRQKVGFVAQFGDQGQFMLDTLADIGRLAGRIAPAQTALGFVAQPGGRRVAGRRDFLRVFIAQLVE